MEIIQATAAQLDELISFYQVVADHMEERAIRQWHWGRYPNEDLIRRDVEAGRLCWTMFNRSCGAAAATAYGATRARRIAGQSGCMKKWVSA